MFPTRLVTKPPSSPTLLPAYPSLVRPFTTLAPRLATKITRDDCTYSPLHTSQITCMIVHNWLTLPLHTAKSELSYIEF
jgi:hypothetical protein